LGSYARGVASTGATPHAPWRRLSVMAGTAVLVVVADAMTKSWALVHARGWPPRSPMRGVEFTVTLNHGSAFGLGHSSPAAPVVLVVLATATLAWLLWMARRLLWNAGVAAVPLGLAIGGTLGNLADRTLRTIPVWGQIPRPAVVDFIVLRAGNAAWPAFNGADIALVIGLPWLAILLLRQPPTPRS